MTHSLSIRRTPLVGAHWFFSLILTFFLLPCAWADAPAQAARVADVSGVAWLFDVDNRAWTPLMRNQTVAQGDRLRTSASARLSLRIGSSSVWLDGNSELVFNQLDDGRVVLQLDQGGMGLRLRSREAVVQYTVLTREGRVLADSEGLFRVDQLDRVTRVMALQGRGRFEGERTGSLQRSWLREGEQFEFWWDDGLRAASLGAVRDPFNDWLLTQSAQQRVGNAVSQGYVSSEMTGVDELDQYGRWEQASDYGAVWIPTQVGSDWTPYRDGRWTWTQQWGWSWVDNAPWGFAPFHYGRWVSWRGRWVWAPGRYEPRPAYAPALVGWGATVGSVPHLRHEPPRQGWYPLAPNDRYVPVPIRSPAHPQRFSDDRAPVTQPKPLGNAQAPIPFDDERRPRESLQPRTWEQPRVAPQQPTPFAPIFRPAAPAAGNNVPFGQPSKPATPHPGGRSWDSPPSGPLPVAPATNPRARDDRDGTSRVAPGPTAAPPFHAIAPGPQPRPPADAAQERRRQIESEQEREKRRRELY